MSSLVEIDNPLIYSDTLIVVLSNAFSSFQFLCSSYCALVDTLSLI